MPTGSGGGLAAVQTNSTLTGTGTSVSPLSVAGWPLAFYTNVTNQGASTGLGGANQVYIIGFANPSNVTFANISVAIQTADAVNLYDLGVYNQAGSLLAHIGAQSLPSTGNQTFAVSGGSKTISAGLYVFAFTGNSTTAALKQDSGTVLIWIRNTNVATSAAGVLPGSIGALTVAVGAFPIGFALS